MENDAEKCFYNYQDNAVETRPNNDKRGENLLMGETVQCILLTYVSTPFSKLHDSADPSLDNGKETRPHDGQEGKNTFCIINTSASDGYKTALVLLTR